MNQFSQDILKTLIEINSDLNSDYSDINALLFKILRAAMRFVKCERVIYVDRDLGSWRLTISCMIEGSNQRLCNKPLENMSTASRVIASQKKVINNDVENDPYFSELLNDRSASKVTTLMALPVCAGKDVIGVVELMNKENGLQFNEEDSELIEIMLKLAGYALNYAKTMANKDREISNLRTHSPTNLNTKTKFHDFIYKSDIVQDLMKVVKRAAQTNSVVLLTGESGVGKELFAEQIYLNSRRSSKPFVRVNCAALSETLMESELFGHIKGAYTSADSTQKGRFEAADGGTIFLDEVGEIPLSLQPKLLRVIQDKQFERVGSSETITVDVRIVAATNRNLLQMVKDGTFREDLYFRLNVLPIRIPPLRERKDDIKGIAENFLRKYSKEIEQDYKGFAPDAISALEQYNWPGNVRELENIISRACVMGNPPTLHAFDLRLSESNALTVEHSNEVYSQYAEVVSQGQYKTLKSAIEQFKRAYIIKVLEDVNWNQTKASKILDIQRTYVSRLISELSIKEKK